MINIPYGCSLVSSLFEIILMSIQKIWTKMKRSIYLALILRLIWSYGCVNNEFLVFFVLFSFFLFSSFDFLPLWLCKYFGKQWRPGWNTVACGSHQCLHLLQKQKTKCYITCDASKIFYNQPPCLKFDHFKVPCICNQFLNPLMP